MSFRDFTADSMCWRSTGWRAATGDREHDSWRVMPSEERPPLGRMGRNTRSGRKERFRSISVLSVCLSRDRSIETQARQGGTSADNADFGEIAVKLPDSLCFTGLWWYHLLIIVPDRFVTGLRRIRALVNANSRVFVHRGAPASKGLWARFGCCHVSISSQSSDRCTSSREAQHSDRETSPEQNLSCHSGARPQQCLACTARVRDGWHAQALAIGRC